MAAHLTSGGRRLLLLVVVALAVTVTACGGGTQKAGGRSSTSPPPPTLAVPGHGSPSARSGTASPALSTTSSTGPDRGFLPGHAYDAGWRAGQQLAVLGVAAGSTLAVLKTPAATPSATAVTVTSLSPVAVRLRATGRARQVGTALWTEIVADGVTGWAETAHLAVAAETADATADAVELLGRRPTEETMLDLGKAVAAAFVSTEPPSQVTVAVAPTVGDLGEITMDVVGLADDSVAGQRLHIFGTPGVESFTLKSVEATPLCVRGVVNGRCV
ncbi:MAG: N-acetylmuramoyl-L-alanine amidase [Actinomycetota bacterium]|nr:N-acetylmuramoyl-L-alanine amidase [Actinomycetota bacterium]